MSLGAACRGRRAACHLGLHVGLDACPCCRYSVIVVVLRMPSGFHLRVHTPLLRKSKGPLTWGGQCDATAMSLLVVDARTSPVHWVTTKSTAGWGRPAYVAMITLDYRSEDGRYSRRIRYRWHEHRRVGLWPFSAVAVVCVIPLSFQYAIRVLVSTSAPASGRSCPSSSREGEGG